MQEKFIKKSLELIVKDKGTFIGCISTEDQDKVDDIILQEGISFKSLPLPFLYEHNTKNNWVLGFIVKSYIQDKKMMVEGWYDLNNVVDSGLTIEEKFAKYEAAKQGMDKLSIGLGYTVNDIETKDDIRIIKRCVISEVSQVKNPANPYTFFQEVKNSNNNVQNLNNTLMSLYNKEKEIYEARENELKVTRKQTIKEIYNNIENAEKLSDIKRCIRTLKEMYAIKPEELTTKMFRFFQKKYLTTKELSSTLEADARFEGDMPSYNIDNMSVSKAETEKSQQININNIKSFDKLLELYYLQKKE